MICCFLIQPVDHRVLGRLLCSILSRSILLRILFGTDKSKIPWYLLYSLKSPFFVSLISMPCFHSSGKLSSSQIFLMSLYRMRNRCFNISFDGFCCYLIRSCRFSILERADCLHDLSLLECNSWSEGPCRLAVCQCSTHLFRCSSVVAKGFPFLSFTGLFVCWNLFESFLESFPVLLLFQLVWLDCRYPLVYLSWCFS